MYLRIALNAPVWRLFDYLPPPGTRTEALRPGIRVCVPFGSRQPIGVLVATAERTEVATSRLRAAIALVDDAPILSAELLELTHWAASYYRHPPGEVVAAALPALLRRARPLETTSWLWRTTGRGREVDLATLARRAPRQAAVLALLERNPGGTSPAELAQAGGDWRGALKALGRRGLVERVAASPPGIEPLRPAPEPGPELTDHQQHAVVSIRDTLGAGFHCFLLHGVTGSGKTEVYLQVVDEVLRSGRQALVLVPEIGLTPQLVGRFRRRLGAPVAVLHSGLTETDRLTAWRTARDGTAGIVLGTRSAVFAPLDSPGIFVVDEEHDPSLKQQEGFRYHARDVAVLRAQRLGIPIVLGSATPSLESLHNAIQGRYRELVLPQRPGASSEPRVRLIDLRRNPTRQGLSGPLLEAMHAHLAGGGQVLIFLNRRGYAPTWFCAACGWCAECKRCDARLTFHRGGRAGEARLRCHHCGSEQPVPPQCARCGAGANPVGQGTEQVEEALAEHFPDFAVARIDRDSTRRRGSMETLLDDVQRGATRILVGTQMLTKGHHFPDVSLVGVLNADQGLFGSDFRSNERLAQLIVQVAGRAGRAERPGEVLVQTEFPEHPLLQRLVHEGYPGFARAALDERRTTGWPPFSALALLRAEAAARERPMAFLEHARERAEPLLDTGVRLLGPAPAPMERRQGRYRAQLLLQADRRPELQRLLGAWIPELERLPDARRVRWSVDVDPAEL